MVTAENPVRVVLGYTPADEMFMLEDFEHFSDDITVLCDKLMAHMDRRDADGCFDKGNMHVPGLWPMLRALDHKVERGQFSLEACMDADLEHAWDAHKNGRWKSESL